MKSMKTRWHLLVALSIAAIAVLGASVVKAETIKKLHPSVLQVNNESIINDATDATTGVSDTIDLSAGSLDKISWAVYITSGLGTGTGTIALQISPDGGSTWFSNYSFNLSTNGVTAITTYYCDVPVSPGTKARFVPTLTSNTTWYDYKIWAMPMVQ